MPFKEVKQQVGNTDIYLLDQILKGRIKKDDLVLDTGCGGGRNLHLLIENNIKFIAFDPSKSTIESLKGTFPNHKNSFRVSTIEDFQSEEKFNFIICNAVLHFAKNHRNFKEMFDSLVKFLDPKGILFIRMVSNIGIEDLTEELKDGVYKIPDGSTRYLLTKVMLKELLQEYKLEFVDPLKTVNVDDKRCMSTLVLRKN